MIVFLLVFFVIVLLIANHLAREIPERKRCDTFVFVDPSCVHAQIEVPGLEIFEDGHGITFAY
jgi:hypothetical protein